MRARCFKALLALLISGASGPLAEAQLTQIFSATDHWKYFTDCQSDLSWTAPGFDDSAWLSGPGGFTGGETSPTLLPVLNTTSLPAPFGQTPAGHAMYFRKHFTMGATNNVSLIASNAIDDGAIIYLNGTRIISLRGPADGACASFSGGAIGTGTDALLWEVTTLDPAQFGGILIPNGDNVLAVSVHQINSGSSDMVFAMALMSTNTVGTPNTPPSVTLTNPANGATFTSPVTITLGASASDSDGTVAQVDFYQNGSFLGTDSTSPYSFTWSGVNPGSYTLRAVATDNRSAATTSAPVNITVTGVANQPPTVSITSPANNSTYNAPTNLPVTVNASDPDGPVAKVEFFRSGFKIGESTTSPFNFTWTNALVGTFQLTAVASDAFNAMGTSAPVSITFTGAAPSTIFPTGSVWKYLDNGTDQGTAWTAIGFNDSSWASGPGQLGYGDGDEATRVEDNPTPGYNPSDTDRYITTYFRRAFNVPNPTAYSFLQAIYRRDDGIVAYLNGTEVFRNNIAPGPVNYLTLAQTATDDGNAFFTNTISSGLLVAGANVMAVEIHQTLPGSSDISFDLELDGNTGAIFNNPPTVALNSPANNSTYTDPANIPLTATASDSDGNVTKVEFFANGSKIGQSTGPQYTFTWGGVTIGNYALSAVATDNLGTTATSSVANVFVVASSAPTIVTHSPTNASVSTLTQITVQFSQPVDGVDASDLLINIAPATAVTTSNNVFYTFTFPPPMDGLVTVRFAAGHGIINRESPPKPFDATATNATWTYTLADNVPPTIVATNPAPGSVLKSLTEVTVTFSEAVGGVNASDLRLNGVGATSMSGYGAGPYMFQFKQPTNGNPIAVTMTWTNTHGIHDFAATPNAFAGGSWSYTLNTNLMETNIVISEIMYHPSSERATEEYVELFNKGATAVNLTGWSLSGAANFNFPNYTLAAGKYLVVAANLAAFNTKYPGVTNVVAGWDGQLSNTDDDIKLNDAAGQRVDSVHYADEGDWSVRVRDPLYPLGWNWLDDADGGGKSLELINPNMPNQYGQNWAASAAVNGTPGASNSVARTNIPPILLDVAHSPLVPQSSDAVTITARVLDEQTNAVTVKLVWRDHSVSPPPGWTTNAMFDDGLHGEGVAGDRVYGAFLPAMPNHAVIEFYVTATDAAGLTRTWPPAARQSDNVTFAQTANALYQVDDTVYTGNQPYYRIIMTETERAILDNITHNDTGNNAQMNCSFITSDGTGVALLYNCGVRIRGAGSRGRIPSNLRMHFPSDRRWHGLTDRNLNTQWPDSQIAGSIFTRKSGAHSEVAIAAQVRVNGTNLAYSVPTGYPYSYQYGSYNSLESRNSDWAANQFPLDPNGNLYTCTRPDASLLYRGTSPGNYTSYQKDTNKGENDYTDIIHLTDVLNNTPDAQYAAAVRQVADVELWLRYFAVLVMVGYDETSIGSDGAPDDFTLYRGINDPRFVLLPHDHDTDFGEGDTGNTPTQYGLFRPTSGSTVVNRFLKFPDFVPLYYGELLRMCNTTFAPAEANKLFDDSLGSWVPSDVLARMKTWTQQRRAFVLSQIPTNLTLNPPALGTQNGFYHTTVATVDLNGLSDAVNTRSVKVNGQIATWTAWQATWSVSGLTLRPGINRIVVESFDGSGRVLETVTLDIWYDTGTSTSVSGTISGSTTWTAAGGPYQVTGNLTVGSGASLTIQPGTTVYLNSGVTITVSGTGVLLAQGTEGQHIRFTKAPASASNWGSLDFINTTVESRVAYVDFDSCGGTTTSDGHNAQVHVNGGSIVFIDHCTWPSSPPVEYISFNGSSFIVQNCVFPTYPKPTVNPQDGQPEMLHGVNGIPAGGYGIFRDNYFGHTWGFNDTIDFTGGQRPGAILQVIDNVFDGAGDDHLDLDSTDAWIEGNIFMHVHRDPARTDQAIDTASAISGGVDVAGQFSEWTIINNLFYDVDHACLNKGGSGSGAGRFIFVNNTLVHVAKEYGAGLPSDIAAFDFTDDNVALPPPSYGAGAYVAGNIIWDCPALTANYNPANHTVIFENNILPLAWGGPGSNNVVTDPQLNLALISNVTNADWRTVKAAFMPRPGSPALGTGIGGFDKGGMNPRGILVFGEPSGVTPSTTATLTLAPGGTFNWGANPPVPPYLWGYTHYKWKLDNGPWSAETAITASPTINLSGLSDGPHTVYVSGKNDAGFYQDDPFVYPSTSGQPAHVTASRTWLVKTGFPGVRLSEVLAANTAAVDVGGGKHPDLIELYNAGSAAVSLTGWGITDEADNPFKFTFPAGASIAAGQYLVLYADNDTTPPGFHLGFSVKQSGDEVFLTSSNGMIIDSVTFGMQLTDLSIGRLANGTWALTQPTFGAANRPARIGNPSTLKINEWLANGLTPFPDDFIELFNPDPLPVALGDLFLTDNPVGAPFLHDIAPLSFIAGAGYAVFIADGNPDLGPDHVNFKLSADQGLIALVAADGTIVDCVYYGPQTTDVSMGRQPNGSSTFGFFSPPTPGSPNPGITVPGQTLVINEVLAQNTRKRAADGSTPDWVEIYNPSGSAIDMADMSLSDDSAQPRKYVFAAGSVVPSLGFRTIRCDPDVPAGTNNTGFGLKSTGQALYLYDKLANGGGELNAVSFGVQAADSSIGRVPNGSSNWVLCVESIGAGNNAGVLGDPNTLKINEWMANPDHGDDWFEIYNPNQQPVALGGMWLSDTISSPAGRMKHKIAPLSFIGTGGWAYQRFEADNNLAGGPEHVSFALSKDGEQLGISTTAGTLIDGVTFGPQTLGVSQGRLPDGTANVVSFPGTASPGDPNYLLLTSIVVNEALTHSDPPFEDAIELRDLTGSNINIGGWYLSDAKHDLKKFLIPGGTILPANGFKVFYEYQFNDTNAGFGFSLNSAKGDEIYLAQTTAGDALTGYRAQVSFGAAENAVSFGRYVTSDGRSEFVAMGLRTFGSDNPDTVAEFRTGTGLPNAYPKIGPIVISEIMYHPPDIGGTNDDTLNEYIELRNITGTTQPLYHPTYTSNTWKLKDAVSFTFPPSLSIPANGFLLVVSFDPADAAQLNAFRSKYGVAAGAAIVGPWSGKLANDEDSVELYKPDMPQSPPDPDAGFVPYILVDKVHYSDSAPWPSCYPNCGADGGGKSLTRVSPDEYGNDPINWTAADPTPGPQGALDTDGDGMPDAWEIQYGLNPNVNDANGDLDGDGMSNLDEYLAGTIPNNPNSYLRIDVVGTGPAVLQFSAAANKSYTVEFKDEVNAPSWTKLMDVPAGVVRTVQVNDPTPRPHRFYRLRTPQSP